MPSCTLLYCLYVHLAVPHFEHSAQLWPSVRRRGRFGVLLLTWSICLIHVKNQWIFAFFSVRCKVVDVTAKTFSSASAPVCRGVIQHIVIRGVEIHAGACLDGYWTHVKRKQKECFHSPSVLFNPCSSMPVYVETKGGTDWWENCLYFPPFPHKSHHRSQWLTLFKCM